MIDRGTRLCPDLLGIGHDKQKFLIFDYCGNFEFFRTPKNANDIKTARSLTEMLFMVRVRLAKELQHLNWRQPQYRDFRQALVGALHLAVETGIPAPL
jgi:type I restriction enzyme R subunit